MLMCDERGRETTMYVYLCFLHNSLHLCPRMQVSEGGHKRAKKTATEFYLLSLRRRTKHLQAQ